MMNQPRRAATTSKVVTMTKRLIAMGSLAARMSIIRYHMTRFSLSGGMTVGFYVWDDKLERLWRDPARQIAHFLTAGVGALIEPDFSLWADAPLAEQLWNTYRTRWMGRYWQEAGIPVIPNLNWSNER